jgi:hypothetical protein
MGLKLPRPKELEEKHEEVLEKNLVWVFAFPRSGTQWFGTQLLTYGTNILTGPSVGIHLGSVQGGMENKFLRNIEFLHKEPGYFFSDLYKKTWTYYLRKLILNRIHAQFQDLSRKIIIPDPEGSEGADIIAECLPKSKIILLLRDGRDSVDSVVDAFRSDTWYTKQGINPPNDPSRLITVKRAATRWVKRMEILSRAYQNHPKELRLKIKYEDLRKNTKEELGKIYKFIGIDIPENELEFLVNKYSFENIPDKKKGAGKVTRSAAPGKWKEHFTDEEIKTMREIMGDTLVNFGYEC